MENKKEKAQKLKRKGGTGEKKKGAEAKKRLKNKEGRR